MPRRQLNQKAEPMFKLVMSIRESTAGMDSPDFAAAVERYAAILEKLGRVQEAERHRKLALAVRSMKKTPGPVRPRGTPVDLIAPSAADDGSARAAQGRATTVSPAFSSRPASLRAFAPVQATADNHFHQQMIGPVGDSYPDSEVELPIRPEIQVNGGDDLLLLLADRIEAPHRTKRAVILDSRVDLLGDVIADLDVGRKLDALVDARARGRNGRKRD